MTDRNDFDGDDEDGEEIDVAAEYARLQRHLASLQDDPEWTEWQSDHAVGLIYFFTKIVTDMPAYPFSRAGLQHAEAAALRYFPDWMSASPDRSPENNPTIDPFQRYIGETFVRSFEGRWINADVAPGYGPEPCVELPFSLVPMAPRTTLTSLVERRRGNRLIRIFDNLERVYQQWVKHGRPAYPEWHAIDERLRELEVL